MVAAMHVMVVARLICDKADMLREITKGSLYYYACSATSSRKTTHFVQRNQCIRILKAEPNNTTEFLRVLFRAFSVIIAIIFQHMHKNCACVGKL
jgi:hypothetical protein